MKNRTTKQKLIITTCIGLAALVLLFILGYATYRTENKTNAYATMPWNPPAWDLPNPDLIASNNDFNIVGKLNQSPYISVGTGFCSAENGVLYFNSPEAWRGQLIYLQGGIYSFQFEIVECGSTVSVALVSPEKQWLVQDSFTACGTQKLNGWVTVTEGEYYLLFYDENGFKAQNIQLEYGANCKGYTPDSSQSFFLGYERGIEDTNSSMQKLIDASYESGYLAGSSANVSTSFLRPVTETALNLLNTEIYPKVKLSIIIGFPIMLSLLLLVLKIIRG